MQAVPSLVKFKDDVFAQVGAVQGLFYPLLAARESEIKKVRSKTFQYGPTDRHQLDVYFPDTTTAAGGKAPVLFYVYGGGFATGSRRHEPPLELLCSNVGAFFAAQGLVTVIADYRLFPNIKFPDPASDIRDAFVFTCQNADEINAGVPVPADFDHVYFAGHSAGANIVATMAFLPDFVPKSLHPRIHGLVLLGGIFSFSPGQPSSPPVDGYYGSLESRAQNAPLALFEHATDDFIRKLPPIVLYRSEWEFGNLAEGIADFRNKISAKLGYEVETRVMKGHLHVTPFISLSCGEGDEWAVEIASWIKSESKSFD